MDEVITAPEGESKPTTEPTVTETPKVEDQTLGEVIETKQEAPKVETVGLDKFMKEKKARQQAEKEIAELKSKIEDGASNSEVSADIEAIAEEHNIDKDFLNKLVKTIKTQTEKDVEEKLSSTLKPIAEKERQTKIDDAFNKHYKLVMDKMPEYDGVINPDVIKTLSLAPQNASKTLPQLIEETYGNAITGKRTIEKTTPGGGKEPAPLDFSRASKDIAYFNEVMSDPKTKAQYNEQMLRKGF